MWAAASSCFELALQQVQQAIALARQERAEQTLV